MKLIELLVKVLPGKGGWPVGAAFAVQDKDRNTIKFGGEDCSVAVGELDNPEVWQGVWNFTSKYDFDHHELANDWHVSVVTRFQYESALTALTENAPQQVESLAWDGKGLPPVGVVCEITAHNNRWGFLAGSSYKGFVVAYSGDEFWFKDEHGTHTVSRTDKVEFKPIRTESERRRESAIDAIQSAFLRITNRDCVGEGIWEHIAEGKIPGVKLCE